ncbi:MAG: phosphoribosylanthranilate isomerase [Saprospiraceae bacterium]
MYLKICGLRQTENINSLLSVQPDYLGFIFYEKSKRYAEGVLDVETFQVLKTWKVLNPNSKIPIKTGVFVNEDLNKIKNIVKKYGLNAVQLHGDESVAFCRELWESVHPPAPLEGGNDPTKICQPYRMATVPSPLEGGRGVSHHLQIMKVFSVNDDFDFSITKKYEPVCDLFLFDTKGKERGGNGVAFNWNILKKYNGEKPFFLSGGIGPDDAAEIKKINHPKLFGVDINSCFEIEPGLKNVDAVRNFVKVLRK